MRSTKNIRGEGSDQSRPKEHGAAGRCGHHRGRGRAAPGRGRAPAKDEVAKGALRHNRIEILRDILRNRNRPEEKTEEVIDVKNSWNAFQILFTGSGMRSPELSRLYAPLAADRGRHRARAGATQAEPQIPTVDQAELRPSLNGGGRRHGHGDKKENGSEVSAHPASIAAINIDNTFNTGINFRGGSSNDRTSNETLGGS